jgi:hypothetical protein
VGGGLLFAQQSPACLVHGVVSYLTSKLPTNIRMLTLSRSLVEAGQGTW